MITVSHIPGASGTTTGRSVCGCCALGGRTGEGPFHIIRRGGAGREAIWGGIELIVGGAEQGGGNIVGALGCRDGVRTCLGGGTLDVPELKTNIRWIHKTSNLVIDMEDKNQCLTI